MNLPNRRIHKCVARRLLDTRYRIMHNRLGIGNQIVHIPNVPAHLRFCPHCEDTPLFMKFLIVMEAWHEVLNISTDS